MARTSYGFGGFGNRFFNQSSNQLSTLDALTKNKELIPVRVEDIVLDDSHPKFKQVGGWTGLGAIFWSPVKGGSGISAVPAYPNNSIIKHYPLLNEIVYLLPLPGNLNKNKNQVRLYYIGQVNIWNHPHHNAFPANPNTSAPSQKKSVEEIELGASNIVSSEPNEIPLGSTFKERLIHPIRPFEGDVIYESRWGSSIRFGSTVKGTPNDWSDDETSTNGDPIIIIRNGQGNVITDPDDPSKDITGEPSIPIVEDINNNESSIYLSSTQKLNLKVASADYTSYTSSSLPPIFPNQFAGEQIILNSGRLVFNSKYDHILLSSAESINLNSQESVNIDTKKFITQADKIFLGNEELAKEPLLLGNTTAQILRDLVYSIKELAKVLQSLKSEPVVNGKPAIFNDLMVEATKTLICLDTLEQQLGYDEETCTITSKRNFTL